MEKAKISVRQLVEFVYRSGDLDASYRSNTRAVEGTKAHKILQSEMGKDYSSEVFLKHEFEYKDIIFILEGRADGIIIADDEVIIDEIKSTYTELEKIDENYSDTHWAQAKCYGYIYCFQNKLDQIAIQLRYYNLKDNKTKSIIKEYTFDDLTKFFEGLIDKYLIWAKLSTSWRVTRNESIKGLEFPFGRYRKGQREFAVAVYNTIANKKRLFVQAPTGVGKTISTLYPAIKSMSTKRNSKIYYLTAKSSTKQVAFDTVKIMEDKGLQLKTTILTAKEKICFKEECDCNPDYCRYAKGYFNRANEALIEALKGNLFDREYIEKISKKYNVCPFEFSLELSLMSDITICDYNYFFDPRVALKREFTKNNIILIDEAHNLVDRTRNMYSTELWKEDFLKVAKSIKNDDKKLYKLFKKINSDLLELKKSIVDNEKYKILEDEPSNMLNNLRKILTLGDEWLTKNSDHKDYNTILDLYFQVLSFIRLSEIVDDNFCYYLEKDNNKFRIKIYCINPSDILLEITKNIGSVIYFSATLTPLKYFRYILGGEKEDYILKLESPFDKDNLNISIVNNLSMKYQAREVNIGALCKCINSTIVKNKGNYIKFFPSYKYMQKVYDEYCETFEFDNIILQHPNMLEDEFNDLINKFHNNNGITLFAVIGGAFSEGIDLTHDKLIGVSIIGTGIPMVCFERNLIKDLFDNKYNMGFEFAYMYPGFNKVLQAAGRVIRTEIDAGVVVLIDSRFNQNRYKKLFPSHWNKLNIANTLNELEDIQNQFWSTKE